MVTGVQTCALPIWGDAGTTWRNIVAFGAQAEKLADVPKGASLVVIGRESSRAYEKDGEQRQWTEVAIDSFGIAPKGQSRASQPSPQGEQWNAPQQAAQQSWGGQAPAPQQQAWPPAAQPGSGQQQWDHSPAQQGLDQPPF